MVRSIELQVYVTVLEDLISPVLSLLREGIELMRHASIQTTMNIDGRAMNHSKRKANSQVVGLPSVNRWEREGRH
jgi:hypothetical protein